MAKAVKCLKINDVIVDPNTGKEVTGICVTISSQESAGKDSKGNNFFSTIDNYYYSESALDAGNTPLNWGTTLNYRYTISCTDAELAGLSDPPMYANELFYTKLKVALLAAGYKDVTVVYYS